MVENKKMASAYVLINTEIGGEEDVIAQLKDMPEVEEVSVVYGVYDIVAKITSDTMENLKEIITTKVRHLSKVRSTMTMIAAESRTIKK
jgi:DNA-binding Lrp family transcriptional regulator